MSAHPTDLTLERFAVDDLGHAAQAEVRAHVDGCTKCRGLLADLETTREADLTALRPDEFLVRVRARRSRRMAHRKRVFAGGFALIAAAFAGTLLLLPRRAAETSMPGLETMRLKGSGVAIYRKRGDRIAVLASTDTIRSGDALRVRLTVPRAGRFWVWFVDTQGQVDRLVEDEPIAMDAGEHTLEGSAVVEAPCRDLTLVVLEARQPDAEQSLKSLVKAGRVGQSGWAPEGAAVHRLRCE
jgi:hypothetical protein